MVGAPAMSAGWRSDIRGWRGERWRWRRWACREVGTVIGGAECSAIQPPLRHRPAHHPERALQPSHLALHLGSRGAASGFGTRGVALQASEEALLFGQLGWWLRGCAIGSGVGNGGGSCRRSLRRPLLPVRFRRAALEQIAAQSA